MLRELVPWFDHIVLTRFQNNPRGVPTEELALIAAEIGCPASAVTQCPTPAAAWNCAQAQTAEDDLICAAGSIFLASEMRELIGTAAATSLAAAG